MLEISHLTLFDIRHDDKNVILSAAKNLFSQLFKKADPSLRSG